MIYQLKTSRQMYKEIVMNEESTQSSRHFTIIQEAMTYGVKIFEIISYKLFFYHTPLL